MSLPIKGQIKVQQKADIKIVIQGSIYIAFTLL